MTVIAWDGKTLAADKRAQKFGLAYTVTKIFCVGNRLVGIAGDAGRGMELVNWLREGGNVAKYPELKDPENSAHLLVVNSDRRVELYESSPHPYTIEDEKWAEGIGRDFALSAMHLGLDAKAAVSYTCQFVPSCGNGIDTLTLDDIKP